MKSKLVIKFLFALAAGALCGLLIHMDLAKWNRLGRDAFLSYQAHRFDNSIAFLSPAAGLVICCAIFVLGFMALYEGVAFVGDKLISPAMRGETPSQ